VVERGASVELIDSVVVNGQRYGIRTEPKRIEARRQRSNRRNRRRGPTLMGYPAIQMAVDLERISALLKEHLSPLQEKVVRLYFGLGCSKSFSATEIAREFQVSRQMISGIVGRAQTKLAPVGLTPGVLGEAAHLQAKPGAIRSRNLRPTRFVRNLP
jgi:hypothetical protein